MKMLTRRESFEAARFDAFRAKGSTIYLAQANDLGDMLHIAGRLCFLCLKESRVGSLFGS